MKFSNIIAVLSASIASVSAYQTTGKETVDILVDYSIKETPEVTKNDVASWTNGEEITIQYTLSNNEETEISIIGVTGQFLNPVTKEAVTNLTQGRIGPVQVAAGQSARFEQTVAVNLVPNNYELVPQVFIVQGELVKVIPCRGQLASVLDKAISFFDPRLIFLEVVLLASFAGLLYLAYQIWGKNYIQGTAPVVKTKKSVKSPSPVATSSSAGSSTGAGYDVNWLPEGHLKQKKTKKVA
ncbi:IRC22 [Candida margitis]|uniref:IRC22 n=1 Tax=Candida margitis TaxID=1775924 RepID=UPI0022279367|nr:IRC22 [Candida margitis]KAI5960256.1 IRC22 [Candida margitis]